MPVKYPENLPRGLYSGRSYQLVSPLMRSELDSGRARQRRRFANVPEGAQISWLFNDGQAAAFIAWWRDVTVDGSLWFACPLYHPGRGYTDYTCRFTGPYNGPSRVGPDLWSISAELELRERAAPDIGYGEFPDLLIYASTFDIAVNSRLPLNKYQIYNATVDSALNTEWPAP